MGKKVNQEALNATLRFLDKMGQTNVEQLKQADPAAAGQMEQLSALFSDTEFCKQFLTCADKQQAVQLFADHGLTPTEADIDRLIFQLNGLVQKLVENDGVLSEEELEQIAGGANAKAGVIGGLTGFMTGLGGGATVGSIFCPGLGTLIGAIIGGVAGGLGLGLGAGLGLDEDDF